MTADCEIQKEMYGLPQAGIIAQELLEERLAKHGYTQSKIIHGLWKHKTRTTCFTLFVGNFAEKYTNEQDAEHLISMLKQDYIITIDQEATKYIGLTIEWDFKNNQDHTHMRGYLDKALILSNTRHQKRNKNHRIPTFAQTMEPKNNTPKWKKTSPPLTKKIQNTSKQSQEHCFIMAKQ
jgi:hypothetical protein